MTFTHEAHFWNKSYIATFMIALCAFLPLHTTTSLAGRSNNASYNQGVSVSNQPSTNEKIYVPPKKQLSNTRLSLDDSLTGSTPPSEDYLVNGELLIDPSYPISHTHSPDGVQVLKPSKIVSSTLLTAATPSPTASNNLSPNYDRLDNYTNNNWNQTGNFPILSGSMTITMPTAIPLVPNKAKHNNASTSFSSLSSNTVIGFVTPQIDIPSTPTTSTTYIYATSSPIPYGPNSNAMNSASCRLIFTPFYRRISLGLLIFLISWISKI